MMKTYAYEFGDSLYINLTNRCSNNCEFCLRNFSKGVGDNDLWLNLEPSFDDVVDALEQFPLKKYKEIVFCGFGEPTYRLSVLIQVATWLKRKNLTTRINTNGHACLINKRDDVAKLLAPVIDIVSVSLNASTKELYDEICRPLPDFKEGGYDAVKKFISDCVKEGIDTRASVVDFIGDEEVESCRVLAESLGAKFRSRETIHSDEEA